MKGRRVISLFHSNKEKFNFICQENESHVKLDVALTDILFSVKSRWLTFHDNSTKDEIAEESSVAKLKLIYSNSKTCLTLPPGMPNPPLHSIKYSKKSPMTICNLSNSRFTTLEPFKHFNRFSGIRCLSLRNCNLYEFPLELATPPKHLQFLDLAMNKITQIPTDRVHWKQLLGIDLSQNGITDWPDVLVKDKVPNLKFLSLAWNPITDCGICTGFDNLEHLDLSFTRLDAMPAWIKDCRSLTTLDMSGCRQIDSFAFSKVSHLQKLKMLNVSGVKISDDDIAGRFPELTVLVGRGLTRAEVPIGNFVVFM